MSDAETLDGDTILDAISNLEKIIDGDMEISSEEIEAAKELGLTEEQRDVAARYAGEGRFEVDDSTTPNLGQKLAAGAELPWTFTVDDVEFVMKAGPGSKKSSTTTEWWWTEDGYSFTYYKHDDATNELRIEEADTDE